MNRRMNDQKAKMRQLLSDFGYSYKDGRVIQKRVRGFTSERTVKRCRDLFDACETMRPIIHDREYSERLNKIFLGS